MVGGGVIMGGFERVGEGGGRFRSWSEGGGGGYGR